MIAVVVALQFLTCFGNMQFFLALTIEQFTVCQFVSWFDN